MKLNQFAFDFYRVKRNGDFFTLGNLASSPDVQSLCFAESESFLTKVCKKEKVSCIICTPELSDNEELMNSGKGIAISEKPRMAFYQLHNWLADYNTDYKMTDFPTVIGENCQIHESAIIAESGVVIGDNVLIEEYAVIKPGTIIEDDVVIFTGAIIGGENHIVTRDQNGNLFLIKQLGKCRICKGAAIGYHSMIARGTFPYDETRIGAYTKIENDVEISHNTQIGSNCIITGQCQVCGNSAIGDDSRINPQSVISNQTLVGKNVTVEIGSVVVNNLKDYARVAGNFAIDHMKFLLWHRKKLSRKSGV